MLFFLLFFFMRLTITQNLSSQMNAYAYVRKRKTCVVFLSHRNICHSQALNEKKRPMRLKCNDHLTDDSKKQTCPNSIWNPKDETINRKKMWIHRNHTFIAYKQEKDTHAGILSIDFNEKKILELHTQKLKFSGKMPSLEYETFDRQTYRFRLLIYRV